MRPTKPAADVHRDNADLIARIRSRVEAEEAFRALLEKYWRLLVAWVRPRLRDPSEVEDVVQETFIRAFRAIDRLQDPRCFLGWLLRIARNQAADHARRRREIRSLEGLSEDGGSTCEVPFTFEDPGERLDRGAERLAVLAAVDRLPEKYRLVILLRYFQGLSGVEMARVLGEPEGTVRNRLFRAHEKMRRILQSAPALKAAGAGSDE